MTRRLRILFLCTGNSCRSQMAEGWVRQLKDDRMEPHSAGVDPKPIDPRAVAVMKEVGVDLSGQESKPLSEVMTLAFDAVVTVCDNAHETCPIFPGRTKVIHHGFDDPPRLAAAASSETHALSHYRRVRDEIRAFVEELPKSLGNDADPETSILKEFQS